MAYKKHRKRPEGHFWASWRHSWLEAAMRPALEARGVASAPLCDPAVTGGAVAGLPHAGIEAEIGDELLRGRRRGRSLRSRATAPCRTRLPGQPAPYGPAAAEGLATGTREVSGAGRERCRRRKRGSLRRGAALAHGSAPRRRAPRTFRQPQAKHHHRQPRPVVARPRSRWSDKLLREHSVVRQHVGHRG